MRKFIGPPYWGGPLNLRGGPDPPVPACSPPLTRAIDGESAQNIRNRVFVLFLLAELKVESKPRSSARNNDHGTYGYNYDIAHYPGGSSVHMEAGLGHENLRYATSREPDFIQSGTYHSERLLPSPAYHSRGENAPFYIERVIPHSRGQTQRSSISNPSSEKEYLLSGATAAFISQTQVADPNYRWKNSPQQRLSQEFISSPYESSFQNPKTIQRIPVPSPFYPQTIPVKAPEDHISQTFEDSLFVNPEPRPAVVGPHSPQKHIIFPTGIKSPNTYNDRISQGVDDSPFVGAPPKPVVFAPSTKTHTIPSSIKLPNSYNDRISQVADDSSFVDPVTKHSVVNTASGPGIKSPNSYDDRISQGVDDSSFVDVLQKPIVLTPHTKTHVIPSSVKLPNSYNDRISQIADDSSIVDSIPKHTVVKTAPRQNVKSPTSYDDHISQGVDDSSFLYVPQKPVDHISQLADNSPFLDSIPKHNVGKTIYGPVAISRYQPQKYIISPGVKSANTYNDRISQEVDDSPLRHAPQKPISVAPPTKTHAIPSGVKLQNNYDDRISQVADDSPFVDPVPKYSVVKTAPIPSVKSPNSYDDRISQEVDVSSYVDAPQEPVVLAPHTKTPAIPSSVKLPNYYDDRISQVADDTPLVHPVPKQSAVKTVQGSGVKSPNSYNDHISQGVDDSSFIKEPPKPVAVTPHTKTHVVPSAIKLPNSYNDRISQAADDSSFVDPGPKHNVGKTIPGPGVKLPNTYNDRISQRVDDSPFAYAPGPGVKSPNTYNNRISQGVDDSPLAYAPGPGVKSPNTYNDRLSQGVDDSPFAYAPPRPVAIDRRTKTSAIPSSVKLPNSYDDRISQISDDSSFVDSIPKHSAVKTVPGPSIKSPNTYNDRISQGVDDSPFVDTPPKPVAVAPHTKTSAIPSRVKSPNSYDERISQATYDSPFADTAPKRSIGKTIPGPVGGAPYPPRNHIISSGVKLPNSHDSRISQKIHDSPHSVTYPNAAETLPIQPHVALVPSGPPYTRISYGTEIIHPRVLQDSNGQLLPARNGINHAPASHAMRLPSTVLTSEPHHQNLAPTNRFHAPVSHTIRLPVAHHSAPHSSSAFTSENVLNPSDNAPKEGIPPYPLSHAIRLQPHRLTSSSLRDKSEDLGSENDFKLSAEAPGEDLISVPPASHAIRLQPHRLTSSDETIPNVKPQFDDDPLSNLDSGDKHQEDEISSSPISHAIRLQAGKLGESSLIEKPKFIHI